jgi:hypothetical protein
VQNIVHKNWWAIGKTIGGQELQEFQSTGTNQTAINSTFEGILKHNTTYYVSIICTPVKIKVNILIMYC